VICPACNNSNTQGAKFCINCGQQFSEASADTLDGSGTDSGTRKAAENYVPLDLDNENTLVEIKTGQVLAGQFEIREHLGGGGMGVVYLAWDNQFQKEVAIKVLPAVLSQDREAIEDLREEANVTSELTHRNICRLMGFRSQDGVNFMVMEYVPGKTLRRVLKRLPGNRMTWEELRPIAQDIATALDEAHTTEFLRDGRTVCGVLHRDIKPGNIMITPTGRAKLMDFGIAQEIRNSLSRASRQAKQVSRKPWAGTPGYMSAEQFSGGRLTPACDIYSFAVVLWEALEGRPYISDSLGDESLKFQILHRKYMPAEDIPDHLNAVLEKALSKNPNDRPKTATKLVEMLDSRGNTAKAVAKAALQKQQQEEQKRTQQKLQEQRKQRLREEQQRRAAGTRPEEENGKIHQEKNRRMSKSIKKFAGMFFAVLVVVAFVSFLGQSRRTKNNNSQSSNNDIRSSQPVTPKGMKTKSTDNTAPALAVKVAKSSDGKFLTFDLGGGVSMKLVKIPAGTFMMGSPASEARRGSDEGPQRRVTISKPFYMGIYEVTQEQYQAVLGENPSNFTGAKNPVKKISWNNAAEFCRRLSVKTGKTVRLPTEAQWEYACRAGTTTPFNTGETISTSQANYNGYYTYGSGKKGAYSDKTIPVGSFKPNAFGLYDMHGNVWEWCKDWYDKSYYAKANNRDPQGPDSGEYRVLRGGRWYSDPKNCRSAHRGRDAPNLMVGGSYGFRVVVLD